MKLIVNEKSISLSEALFGYFMVLLVCDFIWHGILHNGLLISLCLLSILKFADKAIVRHIPQNLEQELKDLRGQIGLLKIGYKQGNG